MCLDATQVLTVSLKLVKRSTPKKSEDTVNTIDVNSALEDLPKKFYEVVHLHYLEGLTMTEMSEILGILPGTVKSRLYWARSHLKACLEVEENTHALDLIKQSFHGKFKLTFIFVVTLQLVFVGLAVFSAYQLLTVSDMGSKIEWAVSVVVVIVMFAIARLHFFLELNRQSALREIKRVELQIAVIASQMDANNE